MDQPLPAQIARSQRELEDLAKEWLLRMIERAPLAEVGELPVAWVVNEAPPLIGDIVAALADPEAVPERELETARRDRASRLARLRDGAGAAAQIPRDLAALQALLVETLRREIPERRAGDFTRAVERLAEVFGSLQGTVASALVEERTGGARRDELTGLPGRSQLEEWLQLLVSENRRYAHPFSVALIDIDGLGRINEAYGRDAGDALLVSVAGVIRRQIRTVDQAFRLDEDEFCILAPHQLSDGLLPMAERVGSLISESQASWGPRIGIAVGVACLPEDGETPEAVLEAAERGIFEAKAAGTMAMRSSDGTGAAVQDR